MKGRGWSMRPGGGCKESVKSGAVLFSGYRKGVRELSVQYIVECLGLSISFVSINEHGSATISVYRPTTAAPHAFGPLARCAQHLLTTIQRQPSYHESLSSSAVITEDVLARLSKGRKMSRAAQTKNHHVPIFIAFQASEMKQSRHTA